VAVLADEQSKVLLHALGALREEDRLAISYRYFFDLSDDEMLEALDWPRGTLGSRLARALGRFRQHLEHLALAPPAGFRLTQVAGQLASWNQTELDHGLAALASHFSQVPTHDLTAALLPRLQAMSGGSDGQAWRMAGLPWRCLLAVWHGISRT
jgi:hypothetical protein